MLICTLANVIVSGLLNPTPRSRSSDNLEKYSPLTARKSSSDVSSPLARRLTGDSLLSRESSDGSIAAETHIPLDHSSSPSSTLSKGMSPDSSKAGLFLNILVKLLLN